ncbi:hypothetical protein IEQ34_021791 [Dendrobium chrysotoxum]|uniref:RING-type domain-containing protein n=1 Tax=Dendrobium chrysotoxum TaxID=161865 RepID=A0AAV7G636_DENCH|nr:hypothetical protein IEQ34_021791 [Dendrobium chrysotoxum]
MDAQRAIRCPSCYARMVDANCCVVYLVDYEEEVGDKALRLLLEYGHLFHATCVDPWLRRRWTYCPTHSVEVIPIEIVHD